ncbi:MAG: CotH kinase family protein [Clostridia bacterium]|nr:CotH kinase family protein [Clostridia bacterium]
MKPFCERGGEYRAADCCASMKKVRATRTLFRFFIPIAVLLISLLLYGCGAGESEEATTDVNTSNTQGVAVDSGTSDVANTASETTAEPETTEAVLPPTVLLTVSAERNRNMCADVVGQTGDGYITLPLSAPTDTFSLHSAFVDVETDAASYYFSNGDGETVDLLAPEGCYLTLTDSDGMEFSYEISIDFSGRAIPVVSIDTSGGQGIWSRDYYVDAVISIDAEGVDTWYLPSGFSSLGATYVQIKGRGHSTWNWEKKPYKLKFWEKTSVLGLAPAKKWVLLAGYADYSLMRNYVALEASKVLSPETSPLSQYPVDLFLNGEYVGVYSIGDDHTVSQNRIDLPKNDGGDDVSFLIEVGGYEEDRHIWGTTAYSTDLVRCFSINYPDRNEITQEQADAVIDYLTKTEAAIVALDGYEQYIDVVSFADWFIATEFFYNLESCFRRSCFLHKASGGLLKMGPIWDYDLAFGNLYNDFGRYDIWASLALEYEYVEDNWFCYLMRDPDFLTVLRARWNAKKDELLNRTLYCIDNMSSTLAVSASYNFAKWPILGTRAVLPQPLSIVDYPTYADNVEYIRNFAIARWYRMNELIG